MKFTGSNGQNVRTWILFFVGVTLVIIFALQKNPLNPWWTLIIGAFTCSAVIVSAVQALSGGMQDVAKKVTSETEQARRRRDDLRADPEEANQKTIPSRMGFSFSRAISSVCRSYPVAIQARL